MGTMYVSVVNGSHCDALQVLIKFKSIRLCVERLLQAATVPRCWMPQQQQQQPRVKPPKFAEQFEMAWILVCHCPMPLHRHSSCQVDRDETTQQKYVFFGKRGDCHALDDDKMESLIIQWWPAGCLEADTPNIVKPFLRSHTLPFVNFSFCRRDASDIRAEYAIGHRLMANIVHSFRLFGSRWFGPDDHRMPRNWLAHKL